MSSHDVSSCYVTHAVGMWEAIYHWVLWRRFTLLSLCLHHVISRASTPLTFLLSHTFHEVSSWREDSVSAALEWEGMVIWQVVHILLTHAVCMYDLGQQFWTSFICSRKLPVHILIKKVVTLMSLWKIIITALKCFWKLISSLDIHTI